MIVDMALFPLFVDLKGKKCVVAGGGKVATRKIETLKEFNADIKVVSPVISERITELLESGKLDYCAKSYSEPDIEGAFLVIAATSDSIVNDRIYNDCVKNGIPVNTADNPEKCTFVFPSVVKRDELVIGITTSGNYPVLSKAVREKLDGMLAGNLNGEMLEILKNCRKRAIKEVRDENKRKELLRKILDETVFCDGIVDTKIINDRIDKIFGEYGNEEDN